jgi:hypothetical protein
MTSVFQLLSSFATSHLSLADVIGEGLDESMLSALLRVAIASPVVGGGDPEFLRKVRLRAVSIRNGFS